MTAARPARRHSSPWAAASGLAVAVALVASGCAAADDAAVAVAPPSSSASLALTDDLSPTPDPTPDPTPEPTPSDAPAEAPASDTSTAAPGSALAAVAELAVNGRAPKTGYTRDEFGPAWADVDHNGCDTRNDVLARDLVDVVTREGTQDCVVLTGTLHDAYSGETIAFQRGESTSSLVQIDHVVALSDAWQKGAQQWTPETRRRLANDPLNLLAAKGSLNSQKGDGDAATWLPPNTAFRCAYVARQVSVKRAYGLWVTQAERDAMVRVLSACPDQPLATGGPATVPAATVPAATVPATTAQPAESPAAAQPAEQPPAPEPAADTYYANCTEARAAGAAPLHDGDPGYRPAMDRDKDGVACE